MRNSKKWRFRIYLILLLFPCLELALRIVGAKPFEMTPYSIVAEPKSVLIADDELGFALRPGVFEVTVNEGLHYKVTHDETRRRTDLNQVERDYQKTVSLFGCSYIYGMGVNDEEVASSILQGQFEDVRIDNFGVPGYGTVQGYLQLKKLVELGSQPDLAIFCYADFHDKRNTLSPDYRQDLHVGFLNSSDQAKKAINDANFPFVQVSDSAEMINYVQGDEMYANWFGRSKFASVNFLQDLVEGFKERSLKSDRATELVFQQIKDLCESNQVELIVVLLTPGDEGKNRLRSLGDRGIQVADISVDLTRSEYNNLPFDSHPNKKAHQAYAKSLHKLINSNLWN